LPKRYAPRSRSAKPTGCGRNLGKLQMSKVLFVILFIFSSSLLAQRQRDSTITRDSIPTIEQILELPEEQIDIGLADLVLAKDFYPDLRIESFLYAFNYMADRFNYFFGQHTDPDKRVRALNTFLYRKGEWNDSITFGYDDDDLHVRKLSNKFINGYIATKKGSCITLPMMYVILAERLGFPIYASRLPYHFFVRYVPEKRIPKFQENIEATNGGGYASDKEYRKTFHVPDKSVKNGVYLRTLTKKEYLASLLLINANEWLAHKNIDKAKYFLELSMKYDSTFTSAIINYAIIHLQEAIQLEQKMNEEKKDDMFFYSVYSKNKANNQLSLSPQLPSPLQQQFNIPEPDFSAFQVPMESIFPEIKRPNQNQSVPQSNPPAQFPVNPELQVSLARITTHYVPLIQAKFEVYEKFKQRVEELGIVQEYPESFFQISSKSLKQFQKKGVK
jgi:regulator of sirC expression with transglutaminase-like and TPR domain